MSCLNVYIEQKLGRRWFQLGTVYFTGCFFVNNKLLKDDDVFQLLNNVNSYSDLHCLLDNLDGFFSFIIKKENVLYFAVDRVRSIPLFYSINNDGLFISNDAEAVRKIAKNTELDPIAVQEFTANQVTGKDTLFKDVKQVQAGESIEASLDNVKGIRLSEYRYFTFTHSERYSITDSDMLRKRMLLTFSASIDRLISYADGRQLVLPLSAGYDSRFIALMLYKKGVKNVVCFSYGKSGNFEAVTSKQIADKLGFKWHFVEYTDELWYHWVKSDEYIRYLRMSSGWASLPCTQDWPAVYELKKRNLISSDAIFIPGHVGDSLAGSDVPMIVNSKIRFNTSRFINNLFICYYNNLQNLPKDVLKNKIKNKWRVIKNRTLENLDISSISSPEEYADAYEKWNWLESNPKFIINSVRVYEFWGYDWYLPFLDMEFMEYWKDVPLILRSGKDFYNKTVDEFFLETTQADLPPLNLKECTIRNLRQIISDRIKYTWFHRFYLFIFQCMKKSSIEKNNTNCSISRFDNDFVKQHLGFLGGINFLSSVKFINNINKIMDTNL
ncbi:hypothetical protein [Treponema pedis]|uniref:hypothetical protein n=1 Tax=Treponema pedis TaxID=409322 RepID=UPI003133FC1D